MFAAIIYDINSNESMPCLVTFSDQWLVDSR